MSRIHALLSAQDERRITLPPPAERARLREVEGLTQSQIAEALEVTRASVSAWETGRTEPRGAAREQYAELLRLIAERHPESQEGSTDDSGQ